MFTSRLRISNYIVCNFKSVKFKHQWIQPEGFDTGIKVYNRVADAKVPLIFLNKNCVKWYICGPTVYDVSHIGHASCYVRYDILNRILRNFFDIKPVIALGITDIDDKIIMRSCILNVNYKMLAKKYELEFLQQLKQLNILPPAFILRVTDYIPDIQDFISKIIERGKGYRTEDGSVYYDKVSEKGFWKLSPPTTDPASSLKKGQRSYEDFALWKGVKDREPYWQSPWGKGRPGWHIECSAMASKIFGSQLDLHGGGIDLVFPHHENEETQSCCYHNCDQWVNYWLHTGELLMKDTKMSKSKDNFIPISDFLATYSPNSFRMFCFITRYRSALKYQSQLSMELPVASCNAIKNFLADCDSYARGNWSTGNVSESELFQLLDETKRKVREYLMNDFDTHNCFMSIMNLLKSTVTQLNETPDVSVGRCPAAVAAVSNYIEETFNSFGFQFGLSEATQKTGDSEKIAFIVDQALNFRSKIRDEALSSAEEPLKKNLLTACDSFRKELETAGIAVKDRRSNSTWSFVDINTDIENYRVY